MKKMLLTFCLCVPSALFGQNWNPFLSSATISPSPVVEPASNGSAIITFIFGNGGGDSMPYVAAQPLKLTITLGRGGPNLWRSNDPASAVSGSMAQYFTWLYNPASYTFFGIQNKQIPSNSNGGVGTINIDYISTSNSTSASPQNGMNANIVPAPYMVGSNLQNDDNVNVYTSTSPISLGVDITDFYGKSFPIGNKLFWSTVSENNSDYFNLYHGKKIDEMSKLVKVPAQAINGTSNEKLDYVYTHSNPLVGDNYYRLESVDFDGKENSQGTINLYSKDESTLAIYPNPAKHQLNVIYRNGDLDMINIFLSDSQGRVVYNKKVIFENGSFEEIIPVQNLARGVYLLKLTNFVGYEYSQKINKD